MAGRFPRLRSTVRSFVSSGGDPGYVEGHSPHDTPPGDDRPVRKQRANSAAARRKRDGDPDRKAGLPPELASELNQRSAAMKPYDPHLLKDLSESWVAQAYIDTLAQDAATAPWSIQARDEDADPGDDRIADVSRTLETLHPEKSFRDVRELTARTTLKLGDAAWVKHYYSDGEFAEAIPVDSSMLFKRVDNHGLTEGYVQASYSTQSVEQEFPLEEVVWFEWSSREDHVYGQGPVEKGQSVIEVLEELSEKEMKDLTEGMPPGIVSAVEDEDVPMPQDEFENVRDDWDLREGQRHRAVVTRGKWEFTPLSPGYQELQFLDRNKTWIQSLGAVFKCNAPYAGFDFQEGNKAQNTAQAEAYKQRGFNVLLRQMEEAINRQLIWPEFGDDLQFVFETEQSTAERVEQAQYQQELASAAEEWDRLGRPVTLRDGQLDIEDGEVEAPDEPAGGGGGPFGMDAGGESAADGAESVEASEEEDEARLTKDEVAKLDSVLLAAHESQVQPETLDDIEKRAWGGDESVPGFVMESISRAIRRGNAVFQDIDAVPSRTVARLEDIMEERLTQPQGWSLRSLTEDMAEEWPGVPEEKLEVVARTETASVLNTAREEAYEERSDAATLRYKWVGPQDGRTTDLCEAMKEATHPNYGGTPMTMPDLIRKEQELQAKHFPNLQYREHVPHINCRHTFTRHVER